MREIVSRWHGVYLLEEGAVRQVLPYPADPTVIAERMRARRRGERTEEEERMLALLGDQPTLTRDRRLVGPENPTLGGSSDAAAPTGSPFSDELRRSVMLEVAAESLASAWDPSIHVEEAVRSIADLDQVANSLGERLVSWGSRDLIDLMDEEPTADRIARQLASGVVSAPDRAPEEPELVAARRAIAELYGRVGSVRADLEAAITTALPRRAPNLSALVGPLLAGRLLALAGGLDRLARLPASTIQVLGAERAFFEHLRGRAPPPRHGVLFLHPRIQGAPRRQRGRLARALAGKVAIAARLDSAGTPLRADLATAWEARARAIREAPTTAGGARPKTRSGAPLHRASEHR